MIAKHRNKLAAYFKILIRIGVMSFTGTRKKRAEPSKSVHSPFFERAETQFCIRNPRYELTVFHTYANSLCILSLIETPKQGNRRIIHSRAKIRVLSLNKFSRQAKPLRLPIYHSDTRISYAPWSASHSPEPDIIIMHLEM